MKKQDEGLDMLSASVERLGQMSMGISEELGQQNKMLESMETDLDEAGENLDLVTKKTREFIKVAGGTKNCVVILTLSVIALILFFLILYA
jgi:t-SNARE complex subunit (syntaxin)